MQLIIVHGIYIVVDLNMLPRTMAIGDQIMSSQNIKYTFFLAYKIIFRKSRYNRNSKTRVEIILLLGKFIYVKEISICKSLSFSVPEKVPDSKS